MPARTLNPSLPPDAAQMARVAGYFDDPIAYVRAYWGELDGTFMSRRLTLVVTDRQGKRYPPSMFADGSKNYAGRWLISGYISLTEFGAPMAPSFLGPAVVGQTMTESHPSPGLWFTVMTDARGVFAVDLGKSIDDVVWLHAGVTGLLRSRPPITWESDPAETPVVS